MNCPLCYCEKTELIFKKLDNSITSDSEMVFGTVLNKICKNCGHVFNEKGTHKKIETFYRDSYKLMDISSDAEFKYYSDDDSITYSDWRLNLLLENVSILPSGDILDIGCGKGNFLQSFSQKYYNWNLYGIEGSKSALSFAEEKLPQAQFHEGFFTHNPFDKKFDIIVSLGVIEHLEDPNNFLQTSLNCLKENGIFMFDVPNFKLNPADLFVYDHLNHFTKETLQNLLHTNNLEILKIIENHDRVPLFVICRKTSTKKEIINQYSLMSDLSKHHIEFNESLLNTYQHVNENYDQIGVFGLGIMIWVGIQNNRISKEKIISFFDENDLLIHHKKNGININPIDKINSFNNIPVVFSLSPCYMKNVSSKLNKLKIDYYLPDNFNYFKEFL